MAEPSRDPARVRRMFGGLARRYDLLNHVLSANLDRRWRREAARRLAPGSERVLDLCGGTGDQTIAVARRVPRSEVVCCDFAGPMLDRARRKLRRRGLAGRASVVEADGLALPFREASFDAVTVAFGVRNLADMDRGFREMLRVLRPLGVLVVLEFSRPRGPWLGRLYRFYLRRILPRVGGRLTGQGGAYGYLAETIAGFPEPETLAGRIREAGFAACEWSLLSGGIVAVHRAVAAGSAGGHAPQHQQ